ncbi:conjugal transfer protein TraB [Mesorhizobium sp. M2A.F.Ca.ET.067.02.1.1]|nr:conjugal transfer protein TraB [Mesorhizobium sp. M2A.F.Ca.ET.067.02.1.1]TIU59252.1 MAG: conjugal transfer protein TraB [Mesorhizobium sp.]
MGVQIVQPQLVQESFFNDFVAHQKWFEPYVLAPPQDGARQVAIDVNRRCILAVSSNVGDIEIVADLHPSMKWWGLAATAAGLAMMTSRFWPAAVLTLAGFWLWSAATWTQPDLPQGWKSVDLKYGASLGRDGSLDHHRDLFATVRALAGDGTRFVVLPESALGFWTPTVARLWQQGLHGLDVTVVAGAAVIDERGYDNVMVAISADEARVLYRERLPVPVSMWQPWRAWFGRDGGARADLFANPVVDLSETRIAPLICYEQLIVWPALQSMLHSPEIVIATGNGWWTAGTSIVAIQRASAIAWAKLFAVPIVTAFNI